MQQPIRPHPILTAPRPGLQKPRFSDLTDQDKAYLISILPKVSRTFAVNIQVLRGNTYWCVLIGYLICRILDTIEDSHKLTHKKQLKAFNDFSKIIMSPEPSEKPFQKWGESYRHVSEISYENDLISHTGLVMRAYFRLPRIYRESMLQSILNMSEGMSLIIKRYHADRNAVLKDEKELEEYCYYVAGTVGELLTRIFSISIKNPQKILCLKNLEIQFGLGLQITNILKDFYTDSARGWSYIPQSLLDKHRLSLKDFNSNQYPEKNKIIINHLAKKTAQYHVDSLNYTCLIPRRLFHIRLFCILPLFFAVRTLKILQKNTFEHKENYKMKISRRSVKIIFFISPFLVLSNTLLKTAFYLFRKI